MKGRTLAKHNLTGHVAPKEPKHPDAVPGIRLGEKGTESTDGFSVFLRVPYPIQSRDLPHVSDAPFESTNEGTPIIPLADCDQIAKAVNTPVTEARKDPRRYAIVVDVSAEGETYLQGVNKIDGPVAVRGRTLESRFPSPDGGPADWGDDPTDGVLNIGLDALEKLLKAAKALGAGGIELRMDREKTRWAYTEVGVQRKGPVRVRVLGKDGRELAVGGIMPTIR